ncbi:putative NAD dependent epimerase/dehydratase [Hypomontagnella monticulosa]|nr:putative NAD dependent epimerase/dehydratase [Hypomontagnella monticulosa]
MADASKKERIFITGGSGYVGSVIVEFAIADGYEVYGLSRSEAGDEKLKKLGAVPVRGDLTSVDVLRRESAVADIVIHLADPFSLNPSDGYDKVIEIQKGVADAFADSMQGTNKPLVTTTGVLIVGADPNRNETNEESPLPEDPFVPRHHVEAYDQNLAKKGIRVSTIRLAMYVYGRGGSGAKMLMGAAARNGFSICVDEGDNYVTPVHVDDAARLYLLAAKKAKAGSIFNATSTTDLKFREIADAIGEVIHVPVKSLTAEEATQTLGPVFSKFLRSENRSSSVKAKKELGWEIKEKVSIIDEIKSGSYVALAKEILSGAANVSGH